MAPVRGAAVGAGVVAVAMALVMAFAGCGRTAPRTPGLEAVATVDGRVVAREFFEAELARTGRGRGSDDLKQFLDEIIQREQLVARARRRGLDRDPAVRRAWESAMIARLKETELEPVLRTAAPDEPAPVEAPVTRPTTEVPPDTLRLAVLRLDAPPKTSPTKLRQLEARLEDARSRVLGLPPETVGFGELAVDGSDDAATRLKGGDLGWVETSADRCPLEASVRAAALALESPGDVSPVVRGTDALYLVRLVARQPVSGRPERVAGADALARHRRHIERRKNAENAFLEETRRTIPTTVNTELLARLAAQRCPPADNGADLHGAPPALTAVP